MTVIEVKQLFLIINNCYQNFPIDDAKVAIWHNMLQDIPFGKAQQNLRIYVQSNQYPPTIADIVRSDLQNLPDHEQNRLQTAELLALKDSWMDEAAPPPAEIVERWGRKG